jgi:glucose/arabinose dehydrogenase
VAAEPYDNNVPSPEYPDFDCAKKHLPTMLLPPHAAPLGLLIYHGKTLPRLDGLAIMTLHGYRTLGHKLVALAVNEDGMPKGSLPDVIWNWLTVKGRHPRGSPVSIYEQDDGSIFIADDHNGALLRLARAVSTHP